MTDATAEIRRLLDELGVKWDYGITGAHSTRFKVNGVELTFVEMRDGVTCSTILTPQQAIDATLGRGECRLALVDKDCDTASEYMLDRFFVFDEVYRCSCGATFGHSAEDKPRFCPSCGMRIVEVGE